MPAQAAVEEGLDQELAAQEAAPAVEEAAAAGASEGGAAATASETMQAIPEVGNAASQVASEPTASEKAYGTDEEVTPADRDFLVRATQNRMAAAVGPFVLACSNRR